MEVDLTCCPNCFGKIIWFAGDTFHCQSCDRLYTLEELEEEWASITPDNNYEEDTTP